MTVSTAALPGYLAGTWTISPVNSDVSFTVRHLGVTKVQRPFNAVTGTVITGDAMEQSSVTAVTAADGSDTGFPGRDAYLRDSDVLASTEHKELRFASTRVRITDGGLLVNGALAIHGITKLVTMSVDLGGFGDDPVQQQHVLGLPASVSLRRADFGVSPGIPSLIISDDISVRLDVHAILEA